MVCKVNKVIMEFWIAYDEMTEKSDQEHLTSCHETYMKY